MAKKILVVDNDLLILQFITDLLENEGHQVRTAEDGLSALDILMTYIPDVMFIDLVMPNINGEQLCRIIRKMPVLKHTYAVIISATIAEKSLDFAKLGADAFIVKGPFNQMANHVLAAVEQSDHGIPMGAPEEIMGYKGAYKREITKELISAKSHLETILNNISDAILELTPDGRIVFANPAADVLMGVCEEALLGSKFTELVHEDDRKIIEASLIKIDEGSEKVGLDAPVLINSRFISLSLFPVKGDIRSSVMLVLNDITEALKAEEILKREHEELERRVRERTVEIAKANEQLKKEIQNRMSAEKVLKASEEKYRALFEKSKDAIMITTQYGEFIDANPASSELFGYPKDVILKMNFRELYVDAQDGYKFNKEMKEKGVVLDFETRLRGKGGVEMDCILDVVRRRGEDGSVLEYQGIIRDITEAKRAQEALKISEQRLFQIINLLPDATMVIDLEGKVIAWNRAIEHMTGIKAQEMLGKGNYEYAIPFYGERRPVSINLVSQRDEEIEAKYQYVKKEGESLISEAYDSLVNPGGFLWNKASLLYDGKGEVMGAIESIRDISEMKKSEEALRESEERYRTILESIEDGYYEFDMEGNLIFLNDSLCEILGYSKDELSGMNKRQYTDEENAEELSQIFNKVYTTEKPDKGFDWEIIRKDGNRRYIEASASLRKDSEGRPIGFRGIVRDVSERKQAEEEKGKLEAQLRQAQKMESIGTLAGGLAHDFNNLLMAIQGRITLLLMNKDLTHPDFEHLIGIEGYIDSASNQTRQLLGFARGGKYEVKPIDLNKLVKKENRMFGRTKKEVKIRGKYQENLWSVEADGGQIEQVILNLYVNAWQAMPAGGYLYLETENVILDENYVKPFSIEPGRYVKISVTDTGIGMDKPTQERIFDPFFTTKEMGRGTGLGLASAYGIIKNHGGCINVYSEKDHGTTFNIYLPASDKAIIEEVKPAGGTLNGTETVLFVDDEEVLTETAEPLLGAFGYKVLIARSGEEAIKIYSENKDRIHIVLLDMIMPDMSGSETYNRLKEIDPKVKVLLSSGYSIDGQATEILDRGCNGFIQKPFKMKELTQKLRKILEE